MWLGDETRLIRWNPLLGKPPSGGLIGTPALTDRNLLFWMIDVRRPCGQWRLRQWTEMGDEWGESNYCLVIDLLALGKEMHGEKMSQLDWSRRGEGRKRQRQAESNSGPIGDSSIVRVSLGRIANHTRKRTLASTGDSE